MAALPSIPAAAQDATAAEPVIVLPDPAPVAAPTAASAPTIVLSDPVADPAPVTAAQAESAPAPRATTSQRTTSRVTTSPHAAVPAAVVERSASSASAAGVQAPTAAIAPAPVRSTEVAPLAADPVASPARVTATGEIPLAALLGALGLGVVGGVALTAARRRRRRALETEYAYEPMADEVVVEPAMAPEPVVVRTLEPMPAPAFTASAPAATAFAAPAMGAAATLRQTSRAKGDPIALPEEVPETFEERDALLKELVAAEPDKANPFTSPRARARRAKLIIQSLGRDFRSRKPRIDLSEYTNRWPALRGWQPATA